MIGCVKFMIVSSDAPRAATILQTLRASSRAQTLKALIAFGKSRESFRCDRIAVARRRSSSELAHSRISRAYEIAEERTDRAVSSWSNWRTSPRYALVSFE